MEETFKFKRKLSHFVCGCGAHDDWHLSLSEEEIEPLRIAMDTAREQGRPPFGEEAKAYLCAGGGINVKSLGDLDPSGELVGFLKSLGDGKTVEIEITIREC